MGGAKSLAYLGWDSVLPRSARQGRPEPMTFAAHGCFQVEEVVVVTGNGSDYLTREAPPELPVTGGG